MIFCATATALCLVPGVLTTIWIGLATRDDPHQASLKLLAASGLRMFGVLCVAVLLYFQSPWFQGEDSFLFWVVGAYLADKPRDPLTQLAKSCNPWERRTAIVSTWFFIRAGDVADTFRIAELLVLDSHEMVQKAVGSWLREAGKHQPELLLDFLNRYSGKMPSPMLRPVIENLGKDLPLKYTSA